MRSILPALLINCALFTSAAIDIYSKTKSSKKSKDPIKSKEQEWPIGTIMMYAADTKSLSSWLLCDGSQISRSFYAKLFLVIGTKYGAGDGVHTFNLPDLRGRVVVGVDNSEMRIKGSQDLGKSGGISSQRLTLEQIPSHSHSKGTLSVTPSGSHSHTINDPGHNHQMAQNLYALGGNGIHTFRTREGWGYGIHIISSSSGLAGITINPAADHFHSIQGDTGAVGNNKEFDNAQPYQTANYIIYTG